MTPLHHYPLIAIAGTLALLLCIWEEIIGDGPDYERLRRELKR